MRKLMAAAAAVLMPVCAALAASGKVPNGPYDTTSLDTSYGPAKIQGAVKMGWVSGNGMTICQPVDRAGLPGGPHPGIVFVHGGALTSGERQNYITGNDWCTIWASYGYVAATIDYRLDRAGTGNSWPAPLVDVQLALRFLRAHASTYNLHSGAITCLGDSSGATLCEDVGYYPGIYPSNDPVTKLYTNQIAHANSVVAMFGPALGGSSSPEGILEKYYATSAYSVFVQGTEDTTVSPINSQTMYNILISHDRPAKYISFVGGHEFVGCNGNCYYDAWRQIMNYVGTHDIYFGDQVYKPAL
jgi:acetyl esterase/lipase